MGNVILIWGQYLRYNFKSKDLLNLLQDDKEARKYPDEVVENFSDLMTVIAAAKDERDLYSLKGFHFEKLSGDKGHQRSVRLNKQWRLIISLENDEHGRYILVLSITNHYR